jgi:peroxiredoxin
MSIYTLPEGLPAPVDDGACDHLLGMTVPDLTLDSSSGPVDLRELGADLAVLYVYPRTGLPGRPTPDAWNAIPGARGCTPQSCAFRDHAAELADLGARVAGMSTQTLAEQEEFAQREHMPFPVIADPGRLLGAALRLPTFGFEGMELYKRVTLVLANGHVIRFFYPVFPPHRNAGDVVAWLTGRARDSST